jgi:hydrogenase large subunit
MAKVVVDPVTRIEGHLGFTMETKEVDTGKAKITVVDKAYSHTNLFRGIEIILRGRDPRDAFFITQRICGVCPAPHGEAAIQALDHAYGVNPTPTAVLIRNIIQGAYYVYDHLIHTYLLVGPEIGIVCKYPPMVPPALGKDGARKLGLGSSYVGCVYAQRIANEIVALWGGKFPHHASEYPGGVTVKPTKDRIAQTLTKAVELWDFCVNVALKDLEAIKERNEIVGERVSELLGIEFRGLQDLGPTYGNFLSYGLFPDPENYDDWVKAQDGQPSHRKSAVIHAGAWENGTLKPFERDKIVEYVKYSRYKDEISGMKPWEVEMTNDVVWKDKPGAYGWMKAPRYDGKVYEVGPLARMIVTYGLKWNIEVENPITGESVKVEWEVLNPKGSVIDRVASRVVQALLFTVKVMEWAAKLKEYASEYPIVNPKIPDYKYVPNEGEGWGLWEAPRGALLHYTKIKNKVIANYCCVVPSTWNFGPRDDFGNPGPCEKALEGCWLPKDLSVPEICNAIWGEEDIDLSPLGINKVVKWGDALATALTPLGLAEINMEPADGAKYNTSLALAIIRSFDPCIACGVHMIVR